MNATGSINASTVAAMKQAAKAAKNEIVLNLCNQLSKAKQKNNGYIPYGLINKLIEGAKDVSPGISISCHDVQNMREKLERKGRIVEVEDEGGSEEEADGNEAPPEVPVPTESPTHNLGGRPKGTTIENLRNTSVCMISATNEVVSIYLSEMQKL